MPGLTRLNALLAAGAQGGLLTATALGQCPLSGAGGPAPPAPWPAAAWASPAAYVTAAASYGAPVPSFSGQRDRVEVRRLGRPELQRAFDALARAGYAPTSLRGYSDGAGVYFDETFERSGAAGYVSALDLGEEQYLAKDQALAAAGYRQVSFTRYADGGRYLYGAIWYPPTPALAATPAWGGLNESPRGGLAAVEEVGAPLPGERDVPLAEAEDAPLPQGEDPDRDADEEPDVAADPAPPRPPELPALPPPLPTLPSLPWGVN